MGKTLTFICVAFAFAAIVALPAAAPEPVRTDSGLITPAANSPEGVRVFRGIPFGAPPVGPLRWKAPQPVPSWDGVRKADAFGPVCVQPKGVGRLNVSVDMPDSPKADEDCLYLNVWTGATRAIGATGQRPVMVWIFGGAYTEGAGSSRHNDGEALARKGVVLVTFNYRLGPFGFFSHPELTKESGHNASGNQAVLDSIAALTWVQKNIAAFGGDPANVTIFGESAGAALSAGLVGSPLAKGLFRRAISESGAWMGLGMGPMRSLASAEAPSGRGASPMQASPLAELRTKSTDEISKELRGAGMIADGWAIPEDLSATFAAGRQNAVDVLVGSNKDEGSFILRGPTAEQWTSRVRGRWGDLADAYLNALPGRLRRGSGEVVRDRVQRRDGVAHAPLRPGPGEAREAGVPLLLHTRAARRRRPAEPARDAHGGNSVRLQQPEGRPRLPGHELARAFGGIGGRSQAGRHRVVLLGEFRPHGQPERQGSRAVAGVP